MPPCLVSRKIHLAASAFSAVVEKVQVEARCPRMEEDPFMVI